MCVDAYESTLSSKSYSSGEWWGRGIQAETKISPSLEKALNLQDISDKPYSLLTAQANI